MLDMHTQIKEMYLEIQKEVSQLDPFHNPMNSKDLVFSIFEQKSKLLKENIRLRIQEEFFGLGPLQILLNDPLITEIMITDYNQIWFEKKSEKFKLDDSFVSTDSFEKFVYRFCQDRNMNLNFDHPFAEFSFEAHRWTFVYNQLARGNFQVCIRRKNINSWSLDDLIERQFCNKSEAEAILEIIKTKQNFLVVGPTGSGKTTLLNSLMKIMSPHERAVILEDTEELLIPNTLSCALLTRKKIENQYAEVSLKDLLKVSLRLRPDRIIVGEVRGEEAKDLLQVLSTGHAGSLGTLHAENAAQALLRLEMLIQMGAPQWNLESIRRLIQLSLQGIIVIGFKNGKRCLQGIYKIHSLETHGFILENFQPTFQS